MYDTKYILDATKNGNPAIFGRSMDKLKENAALNNSEPQPAVTVRKLPNAPCVKDCVS